MRYFEHEKKQFELRFMDWKQYFERNVFSNIKFNEKGDNASVIIINLREKPSASDTKKCCCL